MKKYLFIAFWVIIVAFLVAVSTTFRNRSEAMMAVVESKVTAISFQKPVIIEDIRVVPGQQVKKGDTILRVSRPDLTLDIQKEENKLEKLQSQMAQTRQGFASKQALIQIETKGKVQRLEVDLSELSTKRSRQKTVTDRLGNQEGSSTFYDTLAQVKEQAIREEIIATQQYAAQEIARQQQRMMDELKLLDREASLVQKELMALQSEYTQLSKVASTDGIIGTVNVQLDELVAPYKKAVSIFERNPTLIKAFMNEKITYPIQPGDQVEVVSESRLYKIEGTVTELGARVTGYPNKIQPSDQDRQYGQEVFIEIPADNRFLNGEKVFVYSTQEL